MKTSSLLILIAMAPFCLPQSALAGGGAVGTLPSPMSPSASTATVPPGQKVKPGGAAENNDGVKVNNSRIGLSGRELSKGNIFLDPRDASGSDDAESTITCRPHAKGDVSGLDSNDEVIVNRKADVNVTGTGGAITLQSGGRVTVTNNAAPGGDNIVVTPSSGPPTTVTPGNTATIG